MKDKNKITLPVTVTSEYEAAPDDVLESVRLQVEVGIFHLQTLLNHVKRSAESVGAYLEDEAGEISEFLEDAKHTADMGHGITMSIWRAVSELTELQAQDEPNEIERVERVEAVEVVTMPETVKAERVPLASRQTAEIASLALQLSAVLNNQNLPIEIYNAVMDCVGDIYNKGDNEMLNAFESSPEYLKALLLAYAKQEISH